MKIFKLPKKVTLIFYTILCYVTNIYAVSNVIESEENKVVAENSFSSIRKAWLRNIEEYPISNIETSTYGVDAATSSDSTWHSSGSNIYFLEGNVGIGTTPQLGINLAVKGKILAKELIVDINIPGPDYVFDEEYSLPSLLEVETFIQEKKHLPEVPSAKQLEKENLSLSEMNMIILKKIEELTLYIINHEGRIVELEKNIHK